MNEVFVIRNQLGHYWGKGKLWVDGRDPKTVLRVKHQDEAINTLFELSSKDVELRGETIAASLSEKGEPVLKVSDIPLPTAESEDHTAAEPDDQPTAATEAAENTSSAAGGA